jgi:hypothetical protein
MRGGSQLPIPDFEARLKIRGSVTYRSFAGRGQHARDGLRVRSDAELVGEVVEVLAHDIE